MNNNEIDAKLLEDANEEYRRNIKNTTQKFYDTVREEYHKLKGKKKYGVTVYTTEYVMHELANKFFRSPATISNIVFHRV